MRVEAALKEQGMHELLGCVVICPFSSFLLVSHCLVTTNLMFLMLSLRVRSDPTGKRFESSSF